MKAEGASSMSKSIIFRLVRFGNFQEFIAIFLPHIFIEKSQLRPG